MLGLAIHTSSPELGLAISDFNGEMRQQTWAFGRDLSTHLHNTLMDFIAPHSWADLSFLAVAKGPGGFTGTRIGVVTARTLAQQLNIPLFGVSSLAAAAQFVVDTEALTDRHPIPDLAVALKAQRQMQFTAMYKVMTSGVTPGVTLMQPEQVSTPADWQATLEQLDPACRKITLGDDLAKTAPQVLTLAHGQWLEGKRPHWSETLPYYGQHPVDRSYGSTPK